MIAERAYLHGEPGPDTIAVMLDMAQVGPSSVVAVPCAGDGVVATAAARRARLVYAYDSDAAAMARWSYQMNNVKTVVCHFPSLSHALTPALLPCCDAVVMDLSGIGGTRAETYVAQGAGLCRSGGTVVAMLDMADAMRLATPETVIEAGGRRSRLARPIATPLDSPAGCHHVALLIAEARHLDQAKPTVKLCAAAVHP